MRKKIPLILLWCSLAIGQAFAQNAHCSFAAEENTYLKVFLNNQLQNQDPKNYLRLENLQSASYPLRIELLTTQGQLNYSGNIQLQAGFEHNYFIVVQENQVKFYQANISPICSNNSTNPVIITPNSDCQSVLAKPKVKEEDLQRFKQHLNKSFSSERLNAMRDFVSTCNLSASQVASLIELLNFSDEQKNFAKFAYDYTCDPQNYYQVIDKITFSMDKDEIREFIRGKNK